MAITKKSGTNPLGEVFGFPIQNIGSSAERYRANTLCPFNNKVPSCTKDSVSLPLGVCSINEKDSLAITCPIRFRQDWLIIEQSANFLFPAGTSYTSLQEVRLNDANGGSAGNIDFVILSYDSTGKILDFGSLEVQGVYISGNVRQPFEYYMADRVNRTDLQWKATTVRADYLSSSRKRLVPQMIYKGGIFKAWGKKQAVALHETFFNTLPKLTEVDQEKASVAWLIYGLDYSKETETYNLVHRKTVYTEFDAALAEITTPNPGPIDSFIELLQSKLDEKLDINPPNALTLIDILENNR